MYREIPTHILSAINSPISSDNFRLVNIISKQLGLTFKHVYPSQQYLDKFDQMSSTEVSKTLEEYRKPAQPSGVIWELQFDGKGKNIEARSPEWISPLNPETEVVWILSVCLRAPLLIFLESFKEPKGSWKMSSDASAKIQSVLKSISDQTGLSPQNGAYLMSITVDPKLLNESCYMRMDYTEEPNAYQLLVEE